ncbi:hypothetical protein T484DRAFT_2082415 [Baffinella frigidus]|nr:hypothetical protein T484DRAFT_2082415 [Cryptophyta sp. CCMP2293]
MGHPGELTPPGPTPTIPKLDLSGSFMSFAASRATLLSASAIRGGAKPKLLTTVASSQRRIPGYTGHMPTREYNSGRSFGYLEAHDLECKTFRETTGYDFLSSLSSREGRAETMTGSMTVRGDQFTRAEEEVLKAKFKDRRPYDPQRKDLLAGGYMATPRTSRTLTSEQVEATWLKTPERTARERMRNLVPERPGSPEGKHPQQHGPETNRVIAEDYIRRFDLPRGALDPAMDKSWGPSDADVGWTVGCDYEVPKGWIGMGLHVPDWAQARRCFTNWQTVFYPLPSEHLETVLRTGQIPIPGDTLVDGTIAKVVHLTHLGLCEKRDPNTARKDRSATRIYTTPSIRYARMKVAALTRNGGFILHQGKRLAFVLMCKQKATPSSKGGYHICEETIGFSERPGKDKREQISPHFLNNQIEYYTLNRASVVPYRLLISVEEDDAVPTWHDVKWRREDQPTLGASTIPGLGLPYTAFDAPGVERDRREGGLVAPRPKIPYVSFPETRAPRDPNTDAALRVSTQPHEPEAMLMPSKGWRDATIPEGLKHSNRMKARSLKRVLQEMKDAFMINGASLGHKTLLWT